MASIFPYILVRTAGLSPLSWSFDWPDEAAREAAETEAAHQLQQAFNAALTTLPNSHERKAVYNARKRFFQKKQTPPKGWSPIHPGQAARPEMTQLLDGLHSWEKVLARSSQGKIDVEAALLRNWQTIQQAAQQPDLRRALLFASHDLLDRLPAFCAKSPEQFTAKDRQTGLAVLQYLTRGAHKTSPLSRFTIVSLWDWQHPPSPPDPDEPAFLQAARAVVTPNVALLPALYEVLLTAPAFYQSLSLTLNPCITAAGDHGQRQWLYFDGEHESFQQLAQNPAVEAVIRICLARQRSVAWPDLLAELQKDIDAEEHELRNLILELVDLGLLAWQLPERGLTPGWCGALYQYLGYLPAAPLLSEAAALLQWLRTAARTLPFQTLAEAQAAQRQTLQQARDFFERAGSPAPPIPAEQIFFEDVEQAAQVDLPPALIRQLTNQLADCWRLSEPQRLSTFRSALFHFAAAELAPGENRPFLGFCQKFLSQKADWEKLPPLEVRPFRGKIGALLQVYKTEDGQYQAVLNGLFPGGGKLMARWLHLFPADLRASLQGWFPRDAIAFPWQGWSNANFQPALAGASLAVPDGRAVGQAGNPAFLLGELAVLQTAEGPILTYPATGRRIWFSDLGLESPASRPPAMQVLWHLGTPPVSLEGVWPAEQPWEAGSPGWHYRPRLAYQSLVLRRAAWRIDATTWQTWLQPAEPMGQRLLRLRQALLQSNLPAQFFTRFYPQKPQYMDRDSPASLLLLEKMLRGGAGDLYCTELLPERGQGLGGRAEELVLELRTNA